MQAGYGAEEQATRRGRRLERIRREEAAGLLTESEVEAQLARAQRDQRAWAQGAEGERRVAETLQTLERYGWTALHDVHWPGRPKANIDHIAIGPGGVAVIDAKNWSGDVTIREGVLRQNGYRRDDQVAGAGAAAAAVTALLHPTHRTAVVGMICLVAQDQTSTRVGGVAVVGRLQLAPTLAGSRPRLSPYDVADIGRFLQAELGADRVPMPRRGSVRPSPRREAARHVPPAPRPSSGRPRARDGALAWVARLLLTVTATLGTILIAMVGIGAMLAARTP